MAIAIGVHGVSRRFGDVMAVSDLTLEIRAGEFFTLLGSSGSGKSTLLKLIGGFDRPTAGHLSFDGIDVTALPANKRPCNTVFQDLALFPHMNVAENVGYGLRVRRVDPLTEETKVFDALRLVDLEGYQERNIAQLSGGQRQRVALARSLVMEPGILLLDEPLTGLDERLRQQMRDEFGRLHRKTGATFVLVTHNQDEAMSLSDRMAIMHAGKLVQIGTPRDILHRPANEFVARFVGLETILVPERIERRGAGLAVTIGGHCFEVTDYADERLPVRVAIRPDRIRLCPVDQGLPLTVVETQFRGLTYECVSAMTDGTKLTAIIPSELMPKELAPGSLTGARLDAGAIVPVMD